jgi:hypothetical protein
VRRPFDQKTDGQHNTAPCIVGRRSQPNWGAGVSPASKSSRLARISAHSSVGCLLAAAIALCGLAPARAAAPAVTGEEVKLAIRAGIDFLRSAQRGSGGWPDFRLPGGTTALAILALRNAGVPANDPDVVRGAEYLRRVPNQWTYVVGLKAQALAAVDPVRYRNDIQAAANWLISAQRQDGGWGYELDLTRSDHSNSQFALLGLHEAARAGVRVPDTAWRRAEVDWVQTQRNDGGWGYEGRGHETTGSMTTAGVASLHIVGDSLAVGREHGYSNGQAPNCGKYAYNRSVVRGIEWLASHFDVAQNPPRGNYYYYYLYGLERVGILSGLKYIGKHDWYREGAAELVQRQRQNGQWREMDEVVDTSFALLFLGKGHRAVLFNKLKWAADDRWNQDRNDINNLVLAIGDKLGEPVSWQVVDLDAPLEEWLTAPILYFNGHVFPTFTAEQAKKLAEFVRQGGAILAEACCSRPEFRAGFEKFAAQTFPDTPLRRLAPDHPVYHSYSDIPKNVELFGIDIACRTSIIFMPHDVSCLWEQVDVPTLSQRAFALGTNIAAYFVGRQKLPDKLDAVHIVRTEDDNTPPPPSALYIGQIMHNGDWRPDPKALPNLARFLRDQADVDIVLQSFPLQLTDKALREHPVVFMTGHYPFTLTDEEIKALRDYLERGGFLFADACCGRRAFDASFREMAATLFPDHKLTPLPPTHPILSGELGFKLDRVQYRPTVLAEQPNLATPVLEGITIKDRTVLVYSPYSIGCPIDGHACYTCRGLESEDAKKLAANIVLYALSY